MPDVVTLNYATAGELLTADARPALRGMLVLSILSGLCVAAAFFALSGGLFASVVHIGVFAATITIAVRSGGQLAELTGGDRTTRIRLTLDIIALAGLIVIGLAPIGYLFLISRDSNDVAPWAVSLLGVAYALLAGTTYRHLLLYRVLAGLCVQINNMKTAKSLIVLGWVKMIYEAIWLGSCATALLLVATNAMRSYEGVMLNIALVALIATLGFGGLWIWMIVAHALLLRLAGRKPAQGSA